MLREKAEPFTVKIKSVGSTGTQNDLPCYASAQSAGADLCAAIAEPIVLRPGQRCSVPTGWAIELPDRETVALVFARSGLASRQGLALANGVGVIDADYRGEICVLLSNFGDEDVYIEPGQRIAQIVFIPIWRARFQVVGELTETARGSGGFGSTG